MTLCHVTSSEPRIIYCELAERKWKKRYYKHKKSFNDQQYSQRRQFQVMRIPKGKFRCNSQTEMVSSEECHTLLKHLKKVFFMFVSKVCLYENCPYLEFFQTFFREFRLNTEKYSVSLCIQSKCEKTRTNETPSTETFHAALASKKCISTNTFPNKLQESNHSYCQ